MCVCCARADDNGEHFNRSLVIWPNTAMYSSMQLLPSGEVALLFEREKGPTLGGGLNISLVRFNVSDLKPVTKPVPAPAPPPFIPHPATELRVSNVLGSGMVLQRAPALARIWGLATPGDVVTVRVSSAHGNLTATAAADGRWALRVGLTTAGNPHTISISSARGKPVVPIVLSDVLAGEVHFCSGQSNMDFRLGGVFNASHECAVATNPMLRLFTAASNTSSVPLYELAAPPSTWSNGSGWLVASPESACGVQWRTSLTRGTGFSAACFLYANELQRRLSVPVGAVDASWGGTNIEAFMSAQAMAACPNHTDPGPSEIPTPSLLYNAMIQPFAPMTLAVSRPYSLDLSGPRSFPP